MNKIDVSAGAIFLLSVVYFFGGLSSLIALITAVSVHEAGHIAAIRLFGGTVHSIRFGSSGLCIQSSGVYSAIGQLLSILAGPAFGFALAYAASYLGNLSQNVLLLRISGFSLVLSVYNVLPALPLDGGRALECVSSAALGSAKTQTVLAASGLFTGAALLFFGAVNIRTQYGLALFAAGVWVLIAQTGIVKFGRVM